MHLSLRGGRRRRALYVWGFGLATLFCVLAIASTNYGTLDRLTVLIFDAYQRTKPRPEAGAPVAVVDIDESSLRILGQWPWPRSKVAQMVDRLGELGAATIAFDMIFSEPDRTSFDQVVRDLEQAGADVVLPAGALLDNDQLFAEAIARNVVTVGLILSNREGGALPPPKVGFSYAGHNPESFLLSYSGGIANLPILTEAAGGMGFFSFPAAADGVVRTMPLVARTEDNIYPALAIEALRTAQGAGGILLRGTGASGEADTGQPAMTHLKVGAFEVPTGPSGNLWIYYSGLPSLSPISAAVLLDENPPPDLADRIAGHIVLVGTSALGLHDLVATPLTSGVPGVLVQAEIIDQIIGATFLERPDWAGGVEIAAAIFLSLILISAAVYLGPVLGGATAVAMIGSALAISWSAFAYQRLLIDPIVPSAAVIAVYVVSTGLLLLLTDRERQFVRRAFGQYLAPEMIEKLAQDPSALKLGGETREITIMFCDIRGFTTLAEGLDPQELTHLLNSFLTPMTRVLLQSGATIDKYLGDAIMAFWNAPLPIEGHEKRACLAVLDMLKALEELNRVEGRELRIGVGLNTGSCCVGNLGSEQRFGYSAIGDTVNVASRLEGLTKQFGISALISETTAAGAADLALLEIDLVKVVGRTRPMAVFAIIGDANTAQTPEFRALLEEHTRMLLAYRAGDILAAETALDEARRMAPVFLHPVYDIFNKRLAAFRREPPGPAWEGVFEASEK